MTSKRPTHTGGRAAQGSFGEARPGETKKAAGIAADVQRLLADLRRRVVAERAELLRLEERLVAALGEQLGGEELFKRLVDRLLEVGEEAAEKTLSYLVELYRRQRRAANARR